MLGSHHSSVKQLVFSQGNQVEESKSGSSKHDEDDAVQEDVSLMSFGLRLKRQELPRQVTIEDHKKVSELPSTREEGLSPMKEEVQTPRDRLTSPLKSLMGSIRKRRIMQRGAGSPIISRITEEEECDADLLERLEKEEATYQLLQPDSEHQPSDELAEEFVREDGKI